MSNSDTSDLKGQILDAIPTFLAINYLDDQELIVAIAERKIENGMELKAAVAEALEEIITEE